MKQFEITYFYGPTEEYIGKPETVKHMAESGITLGQLTYSTEGNKTALRLLGEQGMRAEVTDARIGKLYREEDFDSVDSVVKEVVEDYRAFDNLIGFDLVDEPNASKFPILGAIVAAFRKYAPDKETVINLFPNYATPGQLGNPTYRDHLEEFVRIVNPHLISYDHYHFIGREKRRSIIVDDTVDEREREIRLAAEKTENRGGFFDNIEIIREIAVKYAIDPMLIVLLIEHGPYRNLTRAELSWEANMCLVYGMKRVSFFTYWEPGFDEHWQWANAMCDQKGNRMQHWYDVQAISGNIRTIGEMLFDKKSLEVFHVGASEKETRPFASYGDIQSIEGNDLVVGFFEDRLMYLVNRDFVRPNTLVIHSKNLLSVWKGGRFEPVPDGQPITLEAGGAVLLKGC